MAPSSGHNKTGWYLINLCCWQQTDGFPLQSTNCRDIHTKSPGHLHLFQFVSLCTLPSNIVLLWGAPCRIKWFSISRFVLYLWIILFISKTQNSAFIFIYGSDLHEKQFKQIGFWSSLSKWYKWNHCVLFGHDCMLKRDVFFGRDCMMRKHFT